MQKAFLEKNMISIEFLDNLDIMIFLSEIETGEILFLNKKIKEEFHLNNTHIGKLSFTIFEGANSKNFNQFCEDEQEYESFLNCSWEEYNSKTNRYYKNTDSFVKIEEDTMVHLRQMIDITDEIVLRHKVEDEQDYNDELLISKSKFFSRVHNKIDLPINKLKGLSNIAMSTKNNLKVDKCVEKISDELSLLDDYMKNLFVMSKIELDKLEIVSQPFSLENMFIDISNKMKDKCHAKNQIFGIKIDMDMPSYFTGDEEKIKLVVINLLDNAIENTPANGKIQIQASMTNLANNKAAVEISINDTGYGMDNNQEKTIINLFDETIQKNITNFDGVGIGLILSQSIVNRLGGEMSLYSSSRFGTTVAFKIDLDIFENQFYENKLSSGLNIQNINVLILDSSFEVCEYFRKIMTRLKINCDTTTSYLGFTDKMEEAIEEDRPYNIVFMEDKIKNMNSLSVARMINEKFKDTKIVVLKNQQSIINDDLFLSMGATHFIEKPLFPSKILDIVNDIVSISDNVIDLTEKEKLDFFSKHILLIDNIKVNQDIIKKLLKETKVKVSMAENLKMGLEMYMENHSSYDLILIDIENHTKDTIKVTKFIRGLSVDNAKTIPIIGMIASTSKKDTDKLLKAGINDYIKKPIDDLSIIDVLKEFFKDKELPDKNRNIDIKNYLDIEDALIRVNGNENVYKALLNNFTNNDNMLKLKYEIANKKYDKAYKTAHSMKSAAANLSLIQVFNVMSQIERNIFDNKDVKKLLHEAEIIYNNTVLAIDKYLF